MCERNFDHLISGSSHINCFVCVCVCEFKARVDRVISGRKHVKSIRCHTIIIFNELKCRNRNENPIGKISGMLPNYLFRAHLVMTYAAGCFSFPDENEVKGEMKILTKSLSSTLCMLLLLLRECVSFSYNFLFPCSLDSLLLVHILKCQNLLAIMVVLLNRHFNTHFKHMQYTYN